ncbi:hypothetical protein LINPERHAP2_LOCUS19205 [Linum perenne]
MCGASAWFSTIMGRRVVERNLPRGEQKLCPLIFSSMVEDEICWWESMMSGKEGKGLITGKSASSAATNKDKGYEKG